MPDPNCPICHGSGFKIIERGGLTAAAKCECGATQRAEKIKETANIPPNYVNATLDGFVRPHDNPVASQALGTAVLQSLAFARDFPKVMPPGLLFTGSPGVGKTHLAVGVMKQLLDRGHECVFFDYQNLLDRIRSGYDPT